MSDPEPPPSIGEQLRLARESRKLSLEQAAYQTHIRLRYLSALETDDSSSFPSEAQARGFLRAYAGYLNLDAEALAALQPGKASEPAAPTPPPSPASEETPPGGEEQPVSAGDANLIVIGQKLRTQRELLGLSVDDVERHSHIRGHYLQALEAGRLDDLPSPVQGRGMLTNYANFLGLDPDPLLLRYAESLQSRLSFRQRMIRSQASPRSRVNVGSRRRLPLDLILGGMVALTLLIFLAWGAMRISDMTRQVTPESTGPSIAEVLSGDSTSTPLPGVQVSPTPTFEETAAPAPADVAAAAPTAEPPTPTPNNAPVQVYIIAIERGWMRVTVDGETAFEGRTLPGSTYPYSGNESIELKTGNGAALKVLFNQTDLGVLGSFGEVIERIFTVSGVQLPTPTVTPTPPPPTATPAVTATSPSIILP